MTKKLDHKELMNVLIYTVFAVVVIPIIAGQVALLVTDGNISSNAPLVALIGLITTFIVLGVVYSIVKSVL